MAKRKMQRMKVGTTPLSSLDSSNLISRRDRIITAASAAGCLLFGSKAAINKQIQLGKKMNDIILSILARCPSPFIFVVRTAQYSSTFGYEWDWEAASLAKILVTVTNGHMNLLTTTTRRSWTSRKKKIWTVGSTASFYVNVISPSLFYYPP